MLPALKHSARTLAHCLCARFSLPRVHDCVCGAGMLTKSKAAAALDPDSDDDLGAIEVRGSRSYFIIALCIALHIALYSSCDPSPTFSSTTLFADPFLFLHPILFSPFTLSFFLFR